MANGRQEQKGCFKAFQDFVVNTCKVAKARGIPMSREDIYYGLKSAIEKLGTILHAIAPVPYDDDSFLDEEYGIPVSPQQIRETLQQIEATDEGQNAMMGISSSEGSSHAIDEEKQDLLNQQQTLLIQQIVFHEEFARNMVLQDEEKELNSLKKKELNHFKTAKESKPSHKVKPRKITLAEFLKSDVTDRNTTQSPNINVTNTKIQQRKTELEQIIAKFTKAKDPNTKAVEQELRTWADHVRGHLGTWADHVRPLIQTSSEPVDVKKFPELGSVNPKEHKERIPGAGHHSQHKGHTKKGTPIRLFDEPTHKPSTKATTFTTKGISTRKEYLAAMASVNLKAVEKRLLVDLKSETDELTREFLKENKELQSKLEEMYIPPNIVSALSDVQNELNRLVDIEMKELASLVYKDIHSIETQTSVHKITAMSFMLQKLIDNPKMTPEQVKIISKGLLIDTKFMHLENQKLPTNMSKFKKCLAVIDKHIKENNDFIREHAGSESKSDKTRSMIASCSNWFLKLLKSAIETISYLVSPKPTAELSRKFDKLREELAKGREVSPEVESPKPKTK